MTSKKQKQAGWLLPDEIETTETKSYCVTIPNEPEYRDAFIGALYTLCKWWSWEKSYIAGDTRARDAAQLWRDVMTYVEVDSCGAMDMIDFRDNPDDLCEVQYSSDGGETWITMFRKDVCAVGVSSMSIETINNSNTTITDNNVIYGDDITNIAIEWTYTGDPADDALTDAAMCWVLKKHVEWICDALKQQLDDGNWLQKAVDNFAEDLISPLNRIAAQIAVGALGPLGNTVEATAWAAAKIWSNVLNAVVGYDSSLLDDPDARGAVACHMYRKLQGAAPQFDVWSTSLDDFPYINDAEDMISQAVDLVNHDEDAYVNFLLMTENINQVSDSLPMCDCPDLFWTHSWNFETHTNAWADFGSPSPSYGEYVEGIGVRSIGQTMGSYIYDGVAGVELGEIAHATTTGLTYHFRIVRGYFGANSDAVRVRADPYVLRDWTQAYVVDGDHNFSVAWEGEDTTRLTCGMCTASIRNSEQAAGSMICVGVTLSGTGNDPYVARITGDKPF